MEEASTLSATSSISFAQTPMRHFNKIMSNRKKEIDAFQDVKTHVIQVEGLDWFPRENGAKHRTDYFELVAQQKASIVRRGEVFGLAVVCKNRAYDLNRDRLAIVVEFGPDPSVPEGTKSIFEMLQRREFCSTNPHEWEALFDRRVGHRVELLIRIPPNVGVGLWKLSIITWYGEKPLAMSGAMWQHHRSEDPFYILFNPFVETDPVFMPHALGREEFLLSEVGKIYLGSHNLVQGRPWVYGQSRDTVLPAVIHVLDSLGKLKPSQRGDPIRVAREIAKIVCSGNGNSGVLLNRSDGNYGNGNEPFQWTGSLPILESFMKNNGEPVKYGQCWVVAGLVTTMFRALGIPCRNVTNFVSGRDPDSSLILEKIFDEHESAKNGKSKVWNFNVWNEIWIRRDDLSDSAYNGWQAIDASKEQGEGLSYRGPTPVEAIRRGDLGIGFETESFFSEVNADLCVYLPDKTSNWGFSPSESNRSQVGQLLVTKGLGYLADDLDNDFERITHHYKDPEAGQSDRQAVLKFNQSSALKFDKLKKKGDLFFEMVDMDKGVYGQEYNVSLFLHNQSRESRWIDITMETSSVFFTGVKAHLIKRGLGTFDLQPNERETLTMTVNCDEYIPRSVEYSHFTNFFVARVRETGQTWTGEDNFVLQKPRLRISTVPDSPRIKTKSKLIISFVNPLHHELTLGYFTVEAPGLIHPTKINFKPVLAKDKAEVQLDIMGWRSGPTTIVATFSSRELFNLNGTHKTNVIS